MLPPVVTWQVLTDFHAGSSRILITTNVLSRGIDVPAITLVIQYDMPVMKGGVADPETYLHRVGRTARAGQPGHAVAFVAADSPSEQALVDEVERCVAGSWKFV